MPRLGEESYACESGVANSRAAPRPRRRAVSGVCLEEQTKHAASQIYYVTALLTLHAS